MSMHTIYIEVSDEITTVIGRLKGAPEDAVALVVPKGAILLQSIVNLKLVKKAAADAGKQVVLVTTDKIGRNLAVQLGLPIVGNERDAAAALAGTLLDSTAAEEEGAKVISGVRIHRYYDEEDGGTEATSEEKAEGSEPIIIPKKLVTRAPEPNEPSRPEPVTIPPEPAKPAPEPEPLTRTTIDEPPEEEPVVEEITPEPEEKTPVKEDEVMPVAAAAAVASTPSTPNRRRKVVGFSIFLLVLLLIAAGAVSFLFLPITTATLHIPAESWSKAYTYTAQPGATPSGTTVAAQLASGEATDKVDFKATGTKNEGTNASGTATLFNNGESAPQDLPAGAVLTIGANSFTTQSAVTVPGAIFSAGQLVKIGQATVAVAANQPGIESNISTPTAATITSPAGSKLTAQITSTSGGTSKQVNVVTATDIANAKVDLLKKLQDASKAKMTDSLKGQNVQLTDTNDAFTLSTFTSSVTAGQEVDNGEVTGTGVTKRLVVPVDPVIAVATQRVVSEEDTSKRTIIDKVEITSYKVASDNQSATLTVQANGKQSAIIPQDSLRTSLAGKNEKAAQEFTALAVPNSTLTFIRKPSWWPLKRLPYFSKWLSLDVKYE